MMIQLIMILIKEQVKKNQGQKIREKKAKKDDLQSDKSEPDERYQT